MNHDDAGEDALAGIDLHVWCVPPPVAVHRPALLVRALSPVPPKRRRIGWIVAAVAVVNAAIVTLVVIILAGSPAVPSTTTVQRAGGGFADVRELVRRLALEQRRLESKLAEIEQLRARIDELREKVRQYEQRDNNRARTIPPPPPDLGPCDEVSCVLGNYEGACCAKYRKPPKGPPENLERAAIAKAIALVRPRIVACNKQSTATGVVKVRVRVGEHGGVESVTLDTTPDLVLGACVVEIIEKTRFPRTRKGGSFSYPFVF